MPFASNDDLPPRVKGNIPSKTGKDLFRQVVNQELDGGRSESVAFAAAWAALANAGFERNDDGKWVKKALPSPSAVHVPSTGRRRRRRRKPRMDKRQLGDDRFTTRMEAEVRSWDLGFTGETHVHETADGQAQFMPGPSHEAYMAAVGHSESEGGLLSALRDLRDLLIGKRAEEPKDGDMDITGTILKADEEQRIVWGWASVVTEKGEPVVDSQGDIIEPDEMEKAANDFMLDARMAKAMHEGEGIGEVIHSLPLTKALGEALGIQSDREGWAIAMKIHDDAVWARVKSGELGAFSIGGAYEHSEEVDA